MRLESKHTGSDLYELARNIFPIYRSITGDGVRTTLKYLKKIIPDMQIHEVASGTRVYDWTVPKEWNISEAYIENNRREKIIDFKKNNLHVVGYSCPIDKWVSKEELKRYIYTQPDQPDVIPYITSYYSLSNVI